MELTEVLHALSDSTRLTIVRSLYEEQEGRACGTFGIDVAPSTLSHHFSVLRKAGLIRQEDRGSKRWTVLRLPEIEQRFPGLLPVLMTIR